MRYHSLFINGLSLLSIAMHCRYQFFDHLSVYYFSGSTFPVQIQIAFLDQGIHRNKKQCMYVIRRYFS